MKSKQTILVTGGAGFVGSFLIDRLVSQGHAVLSVDSLEEQVHAGKKPDYLNPGCRYVWGNCGNRKIIAELLPGVDVVVHLAARVGVAQSMYEMERYVECNELATAVLLEEVAKLKSRPRRMVVASSMSIYGEGAYINGSGANVSVVSRTEQQLKAKQWECVDTVTGESLMPVPTPENKSMMPSSIYAIGKRSQEEMVHAVGRAYGISTVACRFFNIYGTRQALRNPYTGVAAIFSSRLIKGLAPIVFEDGRQTRDFVHVSDVVSALQLSIERMDIDFETFNVGSGQAISVADVARALSEAITGGRVQSEITGDFRAGDIRHCFADITKARNRLGYEPRCRFESSLGELVDWVKRQEIDKDHFDSALRQAAERGLIG